MLRRLAAGLALSLATAGVALAAPPFWAVRDADSTLYLFGTMHVLTPEADWRTPAFDRAVRDSAQLWFEMDAEIAPDEIAKLLQTFGVDRETPLADKVPPATMTALRAALKDQPALLAMAEQMQPWAAAMVVQVLPMIEAGLTMSAGADSTLTREGKAGGKTLRYFETAEAQLRFFSELPPAVQVQFLDDSLETVGASDEDQLAIQKSWIDGDLDRLAPEILDQMRLQRPPLYDALVRRRNAAWVTVLARELAGQGVAMVNVGALHMVGDDGLVAQLKARGFEVERIQ
ncbi:MAG: TraB/GumN family protein [Pseudomonadota bacterium]